MVAAIEIGDRPMDKQWQTLTGVVKDYRHWLTEGQADDPSSDEERTDRMYDIALAAIDFVDSRQAPWN